MKRKTTIPTQIVRMIYTRQNRGLNARAIAKAINVSATAKNLGVEFSHRTVAAVMANLTMGNYSYL